MTRGNEKASQEYWDQVWTKDRVPDPIDPRQPGLGNYVNRRIHEYFVATFGGMPTRSQRLLEIGCARSVWLPYFAREFGFQVSGIDYSEPGCEQAHEVLRQAGVEGQITHADFFAPPTELLDRFDVVVSFGVAEHFADTAECIAAFARFLKPGGLLITMIPNLAGWLGAGQKWLNRPVFDIHVPLDREQLARAHEQAGLQVQKCEYFLSANFAVCNLNGIPVGSFAWFTKRAILKSLIVISRGIWVLDGRRGIIKPTRSIAPYINCRATRKPVD